jgi:YidC/Oxa1 family membrane protein insertase
MEKRLVLAIGLCVGVILLWTTLFPPQKSAPPPAPAPTTTQPAAPPAPNTPPPALFPNANAPAAGGTAPVTNRPEQHVELATPDVSFVFTNQGGNLVHAKLRQKQFLLKSGDPNSGHDLVTATDAAGAPFRLAFESGIPTPADGAWETSQPSPNAVTFAADVGNTHIEKRYRVDPKRYRLQLDVVVSNRAEAPVSSTVILSIGGRQDPEKRGGGFLSAVSANVSSALCFNLHGEKLLRKPIEHLEKEPIAGDEASGQIAWVGTDEKFFLVAAVPSLEGTRTCGSKVTGTDAGVVTLRFAGRDVPAKGEVVYPFALFAGPKVTDDLEAVQPPAPAPAAPGTPATVATDIYLQKAVDVTLGFIAGPILWLLKFFHGFVHNWGVAIILLTLFIRGLLFYFNQKQLVSGKKMQKLAPKMALIRKKYENDRQRQSVETMNLYKAHGVSPFSGCLPGVIQMPIWIALYSTLNYAVELYRAPFFGHIHDLTAKDPFYVTPLLMGGVMFAQMKMSPAGTDPQQQAMMSVMMPIMFTGFSLFLPSGLALYMLTSYLFGIVQQLYVNHLDRKGKITL